MTLELKGVSAGYGAANVLRNVSLETRPGELCAVIGPNGAGKSTLLRVLAGLIEPSSGTIRLNDGPLGALSARERARELAVVHQHTELPFEFSVLEVTLMGLHSTSARFSLDSPEDLKAAREALEELDVAEYADRPLSSLSGGERQRVVLARTLLTGAPLWLLDEPTANLDPKHVLATTKLLRTHRDSGGAALVILHDLNLAASGVFDRTIILKDGEVFADDIPALALTAANLSEVYDVPIRRFDVDGRTLFAVESP